jgi:hypothetical protein
MGSLDSFMGQFGAPPPLSDDNEAVVSTLDELAPVGVGSLDAFVSAFNGALESYWFYNHTVELRFEPVGHIYYLVGELGELTAQDGVTNVNHIIDKSNALVPWCAKVMAEKLLRTVPTITREMLVTGDVTLPVVYVPEMTLEDFTKIVLEAKSAHSDELEKAGDIGHMAHEWLEYYIKALIAGHKLEAESKLLNMPKDERAANCVMAALGWIHRHNVRWIATERKIYSRKYQVAGTMDGLALVDACDDPTCCFTFFKDVLSVADWKSSNYLYIEYLLQTAIYQEALMEEFGQVHGDESLDEDGQRIFDAIAKYGPIRDRWVNRLGKEDGEFDPWHLTPEDFQEDLEGFLDALSLTRSVRLINERMKGQKATIRTAKKVAKALAKEKEKEDKKAAKAIEREEKRVAKELAKIQLKLDKAQAKLDAKRAKLAGVDTAESTSEPKAEPEVTPPNVTPTSVVTVDFTAVERRVVTELSQPPSRPSIVLIPMDLPTEVVVRPTIQLPEERR